MDVIKAQGKNRKAGSADKAISYIKNLYKLEKEAREQNLSPEEIYQMRQEKAKPILDDFEKWLFKRQPGNTAQGFAW